MSTVYYKLFIEKNDAARLSVTVVCLQDFDEVDYDQSRFLLSRETGQQLVFETEPQAVAWLNANVKPEYINPEYVDLNVGIDYIYK